MVHTAARIGFEAGVHSYRRGRPGYAAAVLDELREVLPAGPVVELGPGPGIVTAELVAAGRRVTAVEPLAAMRHALTERVRGAEVLDGRAEAIPVGDGTAAAVVAAQAFHWFEAGAALDEIDRVLGPDGRLVLLWNVRDESVPWVADFGRIMDRHRGDTPTHWSGGWRRAIEADPRFELVHERVVVHHWPTEADGVVDRALSVSFIAALDAPAQDEVVADVRRLVEPLGPSFTFAYRCSIHVWRRVS